MNGGRSGDKLRHKLRISYTLFDWLRVRAELEDRDALTCWMTCNAVNLDLGADADNRSP